MKTLFKKKMDSGLEEDISETEITHPVVTIKRGKDPEVQEVDIALVEQNGNYVSIPQKLCLKLVWKSA